MQGAKETGRRNSGLHQGKALYQRQFLSWNLKDKWELADNEKAGEREGSGGFYRGLRRYMGTETWCVGKTAVVEGSMKNPSGETGMFSCVGEMDYSTGCSHLGDLLGTDPLLSSLTQFLVGFSPLLLDSRPQFLAGSWLKWKGNGTPLQYSCLENPMDGEAWWATVHGVAKSWT